MDRITYYTGNRAPNIVRTLSSQDAGDFDVTPGQTFHLRVRPSWSSAVMLDQPMLPDEVGDTLTYFPQAGDFDAEGIYRAWIYVTLTNGASQDTDEFEIVVLEHAPGEGTRIGAIWRAARALEPVSWDALSHYPDYGDVELQRQIELAKLRALPSTVAAADEDNLDPRVTDYIAKKALVDNVLSAAISFWSNQTIQQTARGNSEEVVTYESRIATAERAILRYRDDLARQQPEVDKILGTSESIYDAPTLNTIGPLLTPSLDEYPAEPVRFPYYPPWRRSRTW
jgi:hypothetical protein